MLLYLTLALVLALYIVLMKQVGKRRKQRIDILEKRLADIKRDRDAEKKRVSDSRDE